MYYIIKDDKIQLFDNNFERIKQTIELGFKPDLVGCEILHTDRPIVDYQFADTKEFFATQNKKEQDKINRLTMTALDFIGVLKSAGLTSQQIEDYLNAHLEIKHQLQYCQNVYCGVVRQLVPLEVEGITITDSMVVDAFRAKHNIL